MRKVVLMMLIAANLCAASGCVGFVGPGGRGGRGGGGFYHHHDWR